MNMEWVAEYKGPPDHPGWYATMHSWDSDEGSFPGVHYWDGKVWKDASGPFGKASSLPIFQRSSDSFDDPREADKWAEDHDPGC
jgi:hypothetical protein